MLTTETKDLQKRESFSADKKTSRARPTHRKAQGVVCERVCVFVCVTHSTNAARELSLVADCAIN
eukprot:m.340135 g.340135  ORF g.340135 m.340135 type:complete len:65 (+) comp20591_c0_seq5:3388-3582(+)